MKTPLQRFWLLLKPDKKEVYQVYVYALFKGIISLSLPLGIQSIINLIQGGQASSSWFLLIFIVIAGIALSGVMQVIQMRITENIQQNIFARAAFEFAYRIPKVKFESIYKHYAPELMNRFFDVLTLQKALSKILIDFSTASLQIIFGLILLSLYHPFFIVFSFLLVILVYAIIKLTAPRGLQTSIKESKYKYKVASWLEELARAKDSFKLSGKTKLPFEKTDAAVIEYIDARESHFYILRSQYIFLLVFKVIVALSLLLVGGMLVIDQQMNIGQFVAAEIIILLIIDSAEKIILTLENIYDILTSLEKIGQVTDLELDSHKGSAKIDENNLQPFSVQVNDISFTYPGRTKLILKNINLDIKSNESICITGENGSGKSTLLHVISGLYQPQNGNICINNLPINNFSFGELYKYFGNSLTEETLFEGTLLENISLGRENVTVENTMWAIDKVGLDDYLKASERGLDSHIDINGSKLSKSVTQKILIARSIVNKPKLLLFENNIDCIEEHERKKIIDFLTDKKNEWTLITVSNDSYFISRCDRTIKLHNGELIK